MIQIRSFTFNAFSENTYVLHDESRECIIIDPGCYEEHEKQKLVAYIEQEKLNPVKLINTHAHIDHVLGNNFIAKKFGLKLEINKLELDGLRSVPVYGRQFYGFMAEPSPEPEVFLDEGDVIIFGNSTLDILFTPGHSAGSISFYNKEQKFIIAGDVLFRGSIGRTDLPGGNYNTLISSIKNKLLPLGDDFTVYSGHGPSTNIGFERVHNPFLKG